MPVPVADPAYEVQPIHAAVRSWGKSPFERTLLPAFTSWFLDRVATYQPDIFVPVETKGARLLEAVLRYASEHMNASLPTPVLYAPALAFLEPEALRASRVLLLDDAARTGATLERHRRRVERYGARDLDLAVCVAAQDTELDGVHTFRSVDSRMYREYLFQLAELVVARGLPPEVDHHVFTLAMGGSLADSWADLIDTLGEWGELSVDGPLTTSADIQSMTLHFPALPGMRPYPTSGCVRDEGARKLRLFADRTTNLIHVVPIAFPALDLPAGNDPHALQRDLCEQVVDAWTGTRDPVATLLLEQAHTLDAELLFRVVSAVTEIDIVRRFAALLGSRLRTYTASFVAERPLLARLYGAAVGEALADRVDADIAAAFAAGAEHPEVRRGTSRQVLSVDAGVIAATREIANYLRAYYVAHSRRPDCDPLKRVGLSVEELSRRVPPSGLDRLVLSRCIDYGLARTILVPFSDVEQLEDGRLRIRRKYRVAESGWDEHESLETISAESAEELIALTARVLSARTDLWPDGAVPYSVISATVAILKAVVEDEEDVNLEIVFSLDGPEIMLGESPGKHSIYSVSSRCFRLVGDDIVPTAEFAEHYNAKTLCLDRRGTTTTERIEHTLTSIAAFLGSADDIEGQLLVWATAAQPRMGLDVIERHVRLAAEGLSRTLNILRRGDRPEAAFVESALQRAADHVAAARATVGQLDDRLEAAAREQWPTPDRGEGRLLASTVAPHEPADLLGLAGQTCDIVEGAAKQLKRLLAAASQPEANEVAERVVDEMVRLEHELCTLLSDPAAPPRSGADATVLAATQIERVLNLARLRACAQAFIYPGQLRTSRPPATRLVTVLCADMKGSTPRSLIERHGDTVGWASDGLNLVAQWARVFGGVEINRRGDDIRIEFSDANSAVVCAAVVQQHARVLRATGRDEMSWAFRAALDTSEITDGDDANPIGRCLNVATKLADFDKDDPAAAERVLVSPWTGEACCARLREEMLERMDAEIEIAPDYATTIATDELRFKPFRADPAKIVQDLLAGRAVAASQAVS